MRASRPLGIANLVVWPRVFDRFRRTVIAASMIAVRGRIQREGEVVHLVAHQLIDGVRSDGPQAEVDTKSPPY